MRISRGYSVERLHKIEKLIGKKDNFDNQIIYENLSIGILTFNKKGYLIDINPAALEITGIPDLDVIKGINLFDNPIIHVNKDKLLEKGNLKFKTILDFENIKKSGFNSSKREGITYISVLILSMESGFLVQISDISEQKKAEKELLWNYQRNKLLADVASNLLANENPQNIIDNLCKKTMEFLECDVFFNYLVDNERGCLHLNAFAGIPDDETQKIEWLEYGVAVCGRVALDSCRIIAENIYETSDPRTELVKSYGVQAYACNPLVIEGKSVGTLSFGTKSRSIFNAEELELMKTVTDHISIAINRLISNQALKESEEKYRILADNLEEQVKEQTKELKEAVMNLERSNNELQQFAYITSHDLQEPLRTIASFTQLLERRYKGQLDGDADEFINYIVDASSRMKQMILDLLEYSRVTTKGENFKPVDSGIIWGNVLNSLKTVITETKAEITQTHLPEVMADESQLTRVFQNLISNSLKYRKENEYPVIHISAERDNEKGEYIFSISDNGIGIEEQYYDRIFTIFQRLHTREEYGGTGIGLSIVKKTIERHGGRVWVESEFDKGSTFYFTLPIRPQ